MEHLKQGICQREDFNIFEVYKMYFDTESKGYITQEDFDNAMKKFKISKTMEINENLKYSDFCSLLLPLSKQHADLAINRMPVYTNYNNQNNETKLREDSKLVGHTHKKLQDLLKEVFSYIIIWEREKEEKENRNYNCW